MSAADDTSAAHPRLPLPNLIAFSTAGLPVAALAINLGVFLPRYYAGHFGLPLAVVGGAFGVVRLIDTFFDPVLGLIMDRTRTRFGRYRPWLVAGAPLMMLPVFMLFNPPGPVSYAYLVAWLFAYYIGTSVLSLAHAAWASVIAAKYHERSRVFGVMQVVGVCGSTALLVLPSIIERVRPGGHPVSAVPAMGWFVFLAIPIGVTLALRSTPERLAPQTEGERFRLADYWEMISRSDMRRIILADLCLALGPGWMSALYLFFFKDIMGFTVAQSSLLLLFSVSGSVFGAAILSRLAMRIGKHRTLMAASTGFSVGLACLILLPRGSMNAVGVFMFIMGFLASSFTLLDRAMVADVGDAVRLEQGQHRVGLLYAMITMTQKVAGSLSIFLSFAVLGAIGYQAKEGAINTPEAIHGLELVYLIVPIVFVMLGGACFIGYKLDSKRHAEIRAALDERDHVIAKPSPPLGVPTG